MLVTSSPCSRNATSMIDLSAVDLSVVREILAAYVPDCEVRVFGSRVTSIAKEFSDLDLVILCDTRIDTGLVAGIESAFEESDLPIRVDVLDWRSLSDSFRAVIEKKYEVLQEGKCGSKGGRHPKNR